MRSGVERKQLPSVHRPITPHCAPCAARDGNIIPFFPSLNQIQVRRSSHIAICEVDPKCDYGANESEVAERMSERADTAEKAEVPRGGAFGRRRTNHGILSQMRLRCGRNHALQNSPSYISSVTLQREAGCAPRKKKRTQVLYSKATTEQQRKNAITVSPQSHLYHSYLKQSIGLSLEAL